MENVLVIIDSHDIPAAEEIAGTLDSYKVYVFDPILIDIVKGSKLHEAELVRWDDCIGYPELVDWAHASAFSIERELDAAVRDLLPETSMAAWQHLNFYYFFSAWRWYSAMWPAVLKKFENVRPHIFICDSPLNFYWSSFIPAVLLLQMLKTVKIDFSGFTYGQRPDETNVVPNLLPCDGETPDFDILTHIPTCFYDNEYFNQELAASGKKIINIHPKYWAVPVQADCYIELIRLEDGQVPIPAELSERAEAFHSVVRDKLDTLLMPYIATSDYRARQVAQFASMYKAQFLTYHLLQRYFAPRKPGKILLSDHDAGFHGPLVSFAHNHNIPVLIVPHAKTVTDIEYGYTGITSLTHAMQGNPVHDANGRRVLHSFLSFPETLSATTHMAGPLTKVGLLLNGFSLNGIHCTSFKAYLDGIRKIAHWCKENGIELNVRCRPGHLLTDVLIDAIGIDRDNLLRAVSCTMPAFSQAHDICLMYDAPTNADIEFLRVSAPILNPIPAPLSKAEAGTANAEAIPRADVDSILRMLDTFKADPVNLHMFRMDQFARYVALLRQAHPLRRFL